MNRNAAAICALACLIVLPGASASGQVVQLPSISTFSYSGSVLAPDRGTTSLGGVSRSAMGSSRRGLSRGFGSSFSRSNASVTATIIDHQEIDRQIRGAEAARRGGRSNTVSGFTRSGAGTRSMGSSNAGTAENRSVTPAPGENDPDAEGKTLVRYARAKYRAGDHRASLEGYRAAIGILSPKLRGLAEAEFRRVFPTVTSPHP